MPIMPVLLVFSVMLSFKIDQNKNQNRSTDIVQNVMGGGGGEEVYMQRPLSNLKSEEYFASEIFEGTFYPNL